MKSGLAAGGTHIWYAPRTGESKTKKARTRNFSMTVLSPHGLRQPDSNSHLAICQVDRAIAEWKCRARNKTSLSSWLEHGHRISDVAKFLRSDQANISMMLLRASPRTKSTTRVDRQESCQTHGLSLFLRQPVGAGELFE